MRFYKLLLGSKNTTCSATRNNGCLPRKNSLQYYGWYETKSPWKLQRSMFSTFWINQTRRLCPSFYCAPPSPTHFRVRFSFGESRGGSSPRRTQNTLRSTAISDISADSTPRRDKGRSEM